MFRLFVSNRSSLELGLLITRLGIGTIFTIYGFMKLVSGPQKWFWLGSQLSNVGITFLPTVWGFVAANIEFLGGLCLIFGFSTRLMTICMSMVMVVALMYHFKHGDEFSVYAQPLGFLIVFLSICVSGPGHYSFDEYLYNKKHKDITSV